MDPFPGNVAAGLVAVFAALLTGCRTGNPNTAIGAVTMTAAGIGAAAASRASGGCVAVCTDGTVCNIGSGLCERRLPNSCDETFTGSCAQAGVATAADGGGIPLPVTPVMQAPDSNHAAPTIVPTAEQRR